MNYGIPASPWSESYGVDLIKKEDGERGDEEPQPQQKCAAGYCLPLDYQKLELPLEEGDDGPTVVKIETEILDFLTVSLFQNHVSEISMSPHIFTQSKN